MFGRYTANLTYWYGSPKLEARAELSFWVLPIKLLATGFGIVLGALVVLYFGIRRYNAWIIRKG
jgi:hypothetical protein